MSEASAEAVEAVEAVIAAALDLYYWEAFQTQPGDIAEAVESVIRKAIINAAPLAKAEALRETADALAPTGALWWGDTGVTVREGPFGPPLVTLDDWLRARAATIEGGSA